MEDSSNSTADSQSTDNQTSTTSENEATTSENEATTSNSTGDSSDGLPGLGGESGDSLGSETEEGHASGVQGPGLANGDFDSFWTDDENSGSDSDDYTYNNTSYSNNEPEPELTVDDVYGKDTETGVLGNQSIVESQGDSAATSNEKSDVETPTFDTQYVMEARKSRDDAEAEDKADQKTESLDSTADEDAVNKPQIGNDDIEKALSKATEEKAQDSQSKSEALTQKTDDMKDADAKLSAVEAKQDELSAAHKATTTDEEKARLEAELQYVNKAKDEARALMEQAVKQNDILTYLDAQKQYTESLNEALQIGNRLTQTDYNKDFVTNVAKANDFTVTLADGTQATYSQLATDMATRSPEIARAMYEAKAQKYEAENHPILANVERAKAAMTDTWLGSKLTRADNQVRDQFNQMAETNMRATYAAYNNVLNDANATPEQKAEASAAINQANSLMTASVALQASTGFLSGIGDSMKDGVYGVTDPAALNAYQKTLNDIDNFAKIALGLGVTPGANRAYQNMYYMADAKVNSSALFSKDFDGDGFALCQEYGNNAAAGMIAGAGELATGVALFFNPATLSAALNLTIDSINTFTDGLYGVEKDARKSEKYTQEVLGYFEEAESIVAETGNKEALDVISSGIAQIENFKMKVDEARNLDNWLEGSGSNTADNSKFNQSLTYDEWLKLIEADPTMREYAKTLIAEKKEK